VNRAVLPHMRRQKQGLLVWVSSSSSAGGTPPYLAPYFGARAAMDAIAVQYARELSRLGIETSIIVPGAFTSGTNHFAHSGKPADEAVICEYDKGPYAGFGEHVQKAFAAIVPPDADASAVADAIVQVVNTTFGKRPFRAHRSHRRRSQRRLHGARSRPRRNAPPCRFVGSAEACSACVGRS
jgi:NAD(P)-dependent dehydrogenase (short-subunit alcohol dehydrogenase family)